MLKQTIVFKDLDGNQVEDDFYFHLNKAELGKLVLSKGEDMETWLQSIIDSNDGALIIDTFEMLVKLSYGVRSENGRTFIKNEQVWQDFYQSDAYSEFFMKLVTDAGFCAKFVNGLMPPDLQEQVAAETAKMNIAKRIEDTPLPDMPVYEAEEAIPDDPEKLLPHHITAMSDDRFERLTSTDLNRMPRETLMAAYARKAGPPSPREPYGYENGQNVL